VSSQGIHTARAPRRLALAGALIAFVALLAPASPAQAHDDLLGSDPAADAQLDALPAQLTLTFTAEIAPDEGASEVQVTDAAGASLVAGAPSAQGNVLTQPLEGTASGAITVLWKVVSSDGHPISGEFGFTVTTPPTPTPTETTTPSPTPTATVAPTESASPSPTAAPADGGSTALPWVFFALIAVAVAGGVTYLLVSRARREKALAEASPPGPQPDSETSADR